LRSFFALRFARKINCRSFAEVQTSDYPIKSSVKRFFIRIVLFFFGAKGIITPIGSGREEDGIFNFLPFAIETKDFDKIYFKDEKINIIMVGKFIRRKGHLLLLRALKSLSDKVDWRLIIVGQNSDSAYLSEVEEFIIKSGLSSQVEIKAETKNEEVLALYREQDLFILSAWNEPAAYSVLEAMAAKLPVIASDDNGTSSYIKEGENGYVFKSRDTADLAEKISIIIADRANLKKIGEKSFVLAQENHSLERYAAKLESLIK
jgi:glycosyltransferase involved in cell wall biosynthesis